MSRILSNLVNAIRRNDHVATTEMVSALLHAKLQQRLTEERKSIGETLLEADFKKITVTSNHPVSKGLSSQYPTNWDKGFDAGWEIGGGGKEQPFLHNGKWFLYVYNRQTGKHAYYSYHDDMYLSDYKTGELAEDWKPGSSSGFLQDLPKSNSTVGKQFEVKCGNCGKVYHITGIGLPNAKCPKCGKHDIASKKLVEDGFDEYAFGEDTNPMNQYEHCGDPWKEPNETSLHETKVNGLIPFKITFKPTKNSPRELSWTRYAKTWEQARKDAIKALKNEFPQAEILDINYQDERNFYTEALRMPQHEVQRIYDQTGDRKETELLCGISKLIVNQNGEVVSYISEGLGDVHLWEVIATIYDDDKIKACINAAGREPDVTQQTGVTKLTWLAKDTVEMNTLVCKLRGVLSASSVIAYGTSKLYYDKYRKV